MKSTRSDRYRPFKSLKKLLEKRSFPLAPQASAGEPGKGEKTVSEGKKDEQCLFLEAMDGVTPLVKEHIVTAKGNTPLATPPSGGPDREVIDRLKMLVRHGKGFVVSQTPEYMEGMGYGVSPDVAERLHRGDFSIQESIDMHGYRVEEAKEAFQAFFKQAIEKRKRAVLIIHGRGLSSRNEPVIKAKVREWLTTGPWRKWVIAFTSARACDGGAGATYVLLRQRPATKRYRKTKGAP